MNRRSLVFLAITILLLLVFAGFTFAEEYTMEEPEYAIYSSGETRRTYGTDVTDFLNQTFRVYDQVGGWYKITAPVSGDYLFMVKAPNITHDFGIRIYFSDPGDEVARFTCHPSDSVQVFTLKDVPAGQTVYWWDSKENTGITNLEEFDLKVCIQNTENEPQESGVCNHIWETIEKEEKDGTSTLWHKCKKCGIEEKTDGVTYSVVNRILLEKHYDQNGFLVAEIKKDSVSGRTIEEHLISWDKSSYKTYSDEIKKYIYDDEIFPDGYCFMLFGAFDGQNYHYTSIIPPDFGDKEKEEVVKKREKQVAIRNGNPYHEVVMKHLQDTINNDPLFDKDEFNGMNEEQKKERLQAIVREIASIFQTEVKGCYFYLDYGTGKNADGSKKNNFGVHFPDGYILSPLLDGGYLFGDSTKKYADTMHFYFSGDKDLPFIVATIAHELRHSVQWDIMTTEDLSLYYIDNSEEKKYVDSLSENLDNYLSVDDENLPKEIEKIIKRYIQEYDIPDNLQKQLTVDSKLGKAIKDYLYITQTLELDAHLMTYQVQAMFENQK